MASRVPSESLNITMFSRIESAIRSTKDHINWLEVHRISAMLKTLKDDETRLKKCIDDIEVFHRDMFALHSKEDKPSVTKNGSSTNDDVNKSKCSVTEVESFVTEPDFLMEEEEFSIQEQDSMMDVQESSSQSLIFKISRSVINGVHSSKNSSDHSYESIVIKDESDYDMNELDVGKNIDEFSDSEDESSVSKDEPSGGKGESSEGTDESSDGKNEPSGGKGESSEGTDESSDGKEESSDGKDEASDGKEESSDDENEMAKNAILNLMADKENEISKLVLLLIRTFSSFQSKLRTVETNVSQVGRIFPGKSDTINIIFRDLSESVLNLDKNVSNIYSKYTEILENVDKILF